MQATRLISASLAAAISLGIPHHGHGQETVVEPVNLATPSPQSLAAPTRSPSDGSILTQRDARAITLKIPAPRGQITSRDGKPFARTVVAYQVALQYPQFPQSEQVDDAYVIEWGRSRIQQLDGVLKNPISRSDEELADHYRHRRWLPLYISGQILEAEAGTLQDKLPSGVMLQPVYRRDYPQGSAAAHLLGYTGRVDRLPTGPINFNEPLWEESEGRSGFELLFDRELSGEDGTKRMLFDEHGNKLLEELVKRPRAGGTLVTTINLEWQQLAERVLRQGCERGALVVIDCVTGEVLVMASRPTFDPNSFVPFISTEDFAKLEQDPSRPLFGRAFQATYPPASAYKPVVALTALNNGVVTERTLIDCPASITLGRTVMRNHSATPAGPIAVKRALAASNNVWFYKVGIRTGPTEFLNMSRRLGMGERTGLPLVGEAAGLVPTSEWMRENHGRRFMDGDSANMAIGQGVLLATPLQIAQAMAGIGNGGVLPQLQLVRQLHDSRGRVLRAPQPERRHSLDVEPDAVRVVREGMRDAVSAGTGRAGALSFTTMAGKTGTAQWGPTRLNQRLAWFAGFFPHDNPRYAFAVLYEGRPGQRISGGGMAAPLVRNFFEPLKDEIRDIIAPPKRALVVVIDEATGTVGPVTEEQQEEVPRALPLDALPVEPDFQDDFIDDIPHAIPVDEARLLENEPPFDEFEEP